MQAAPKIESAKRLPLHVTETMEFSTLVVILMAVIALYCIFHPKLVEGMTGYGTLSGLAYNSKGLYCFKNIYDPESYSGYCTTIGKVVV